ncbi:MAG: NFACT RNA binding domain-containing protein, partial [Clostridiales bacterium]|nr:NFACT RNA binding domain-containing protein [Clostridiales bacterium]
QHRLLISAGASLPLIYFTQQQKQNPATAPNFCMLLRKHIGGGRILNVSQPGLERIIHIEIEHLDEMGDLCRKKLIVELMGKYSNIIFTDEKETIIDSIKHISANISSVREVLPGRPYFIADTVHKLNPLDLSEHDFLDQVCIKPMNVSKAIYSSLTGISPLMAEEVCERSHVESGRPMQALEEFEKLHLFRTFTLMMEDVKNGEFSPRIVYQNKEPVEFSALSLELYDESQQKIYSDISQVLENYYAEKNTVSRIRQKSVDLRKIVQTTLERDCKKYDLQIKQQKSTEKREKYRVWGELIQTYGYGLEPGAKSLTAPNFYENNEEITIPLDPTLTVQENAQKYFERYNKLKRTHEALISLLEETKAEIEHLRSVQVALEIALQEEDLIQIKTELQEAGYIRRHGTPSRKKQKITSRPFHYLSSDGFHIYIGKNNLQNEELTFQFANGGDWWFHAKGIPGSHVVVKTEGKEMPDRTFEEAGALAAYYSSERNSAKVEIDYIQRKFVKKPAGTKPGFVIYHTNYSLMAEPERVQDLQKLDE